MKRLRAVPDARLSLWQSAAAEVARLELLAQSPALDEAGLTERLADHPMVRAAAEHAVRSHNRPAGTFTLPEPDAIGSPQELEAIASEIQFRLTEARLAHDAALEVEMLAACRKYGTCDKGWLSCATTYAQYRLKYGRPEYHPWHEFGRIDQAGVIQYQLPNDARVAVFGDWGTGMEDATAMLVAILKLHKPHAIIHLGDIYYSGTEAECDRTMAVVERAFREAGAAPVPVFAIPGNHEYYAMGKGFYRMLPMLNQSIPGAGQQASFFCLRTEDGAWQFLGADTGCDDSNPAHELLDPTYPGPLLQPTEIEWVRDKLCSFTGSTIMLTHHPLFSQNWPIAGSRSTGKDTPWLNRRMLETFQFFLPKVAAWFWGHEHTFAMYQDNLFGLRKGRLVGCGGTPTHEGDHPYTPRDERYARAVPYHPDMKKLAIGADGYYNNGYALLDFQRSSIGAPIRCTYYEFPSWDQERPQNPVPQKLCEERVESVMTEQKQANETQTIKYGDRVTMKHQSGRVISAAVQGGWTKQYYPRLENTGAVTLVVLGGHPGEPVGDYSVIQIMSTEHAISPYNIMGAFTTDPNVYYYTPYDTAKQSFQVRKLGGGRELHYGEPFELVNQSFSGQRLCASGEWLTTDANARDAWVLLPEPFKPEVKVMDVGSKPEPVHA